MSQILGLQNITFPDFHRDNEVCMALDVMEETVYLMSPAVALELAHLLERHARAVIEKQREALAEFEKREGER